MYDCKVGQWEYGITESIELDRRDIISTLFVCISGHGSSKCEHAGDTMQEENDLLFEGVGHEQPRIEAGQAADRQGVPLR